MAEVSLDRSASGSGPLGRSGGRERGQWSIPTSDAEAGEGGRRRSARAALLSGEERPHERCSALSHQRNKGIPDLISPSASPRAHVLSSPGWMEAAEQVSDDAGEDDDGTGSRRITREEVEGTLPADVVCVVEQLGSATGNFLMNKLWTPPVWGHRKSGSQQRDASLRVTTSSRCHRPDEKELYSPSVLSQSTGRVSSTNNRSPVKPFSSPDEERLNMSTPVRGNRARRSPDLQRHVGHLAATAASLGKSTRTSRCAVVEPFSGSPVHQRRGSTGGANPSAVHRRQNYSSGRTRANLSIDMQNINENAVLEPLTSPQTVRDTTEGQPSGASSILRTAYCHLEQLAQGAVVLDPETDLHPLPERAMDLKRQMYQRRDVALRQALLAIEDVWAAERACQEVSEFGTTVAVPVQQRNHASLMGAVESYLSIHKRVRTWPNELGEDFSEDVLSTPVGASGSLRRGGLMQSTAAPHSKARSGSLTPTRPSLGLHRRSATLDMGNLDPSLLSVEAVERLADCRPHRGPCPCEPDDACGGKTPKGQSGREMMVEFLSCTEEWFITHVASALCDEASNVEAANPAHAVQLLSKMSKVQEWVDATLQRVDADEPLWQLLVDLNGRLRDAVIKAGSQLVMKQQ